MGRGGHKLGPLSENAEKVELCLFDPSGRHEVQRIEIRKHTDQIFHCYLPYGRLSQLYGYRVYGPYDPRTATASTRTNSFSTSTRRRPLVRWAGTIRTLATSLETKGRTSPSRWAGPRHGKTLSLHATRTNKGSWMAGKEGDLQCATDSLTELVQTFGEYCGRGKPRGGQIAVSYDTDRDRAVERTHDHFRWFGPGWKVNADLPGPSSLTRPRRS